MSKRWGQNWKCFRLWKNSQRASKPNPKVFHAPNGKRKKKENNVKNVFSANGQFANWKETIATMKTECDVKKSI